MVATAPETHRTSAAGSTPFLADWQHRHRRTARGPRTGDRPLSWCASTSRHPTMCDARQPRPPLPSRRGPNRATRSVPRFCGARRRSTKRIEPSSAPGRSARRAPIAARCITSRTSRSTRCWPPRPCRGSRTARWCRRSSKGRLSMVRRVPVGVVGAITPVELAERAGHARRCAGTRAGQRRMLKPDPQTPVCGGAVFAAIFKEAGLPDGAAPGGHRRRRGR